MAKPKAARTKRGEQTRRDILEVARRLIASRQSSAVTLDRIAEATGVAKSSILWHFGSKESLLLEVMDSVIHDFEQSFLQRYPAELPPLEKIKLVLKEYVILLETYPEACAVFFDLIFDASQAEGIRERAQQMYQEYREMVVRNLSTPALPVSEELAAGLVGFLDGVFIQWYVDPDKIDIRRVFDAFLKVLAMFKNYPGE